MIHGRVDLIDQTFANADNDRVGRRIDRAPEREEPLQTQVGLQLGADGC